MIKMRKLSKFALLICLSLATTGISMSGFALAGVNQWTSIGPYGAGISSLAIDPSTPTTLYAGTGVGVFKSTDGGATWFQVNTGLSTSSEGGLDVTALVVNPSTPSTLYAGIFGGGVFKSTDGGANWFESNTGLGTWVTALAIDPSTPTTLYHGGPYGLSKSTDEGANWSSASNGLIPYGDLPWTWITTITIDPSTPTTLYAGTRDTRESGGAAGSVFKSTDGAATWSEVNTGFPAYAPVGPGVTTITIDPSTPTTLYAGIYFAGVFMSTNGGANWSESNTGLNNLAVTEVAIDPSTPTTMYARTDIGLSKTTDGGASWSQVLSSHITALAIDPSTPSTLYAGLFKSTDSGTSWTEITDPNISAILAIDPVDSDTLYAKTLKEFWSTAPFFHKSTDGGLSWTGIGPGDDYLLPVYLVIDPLDPDTLYATAITGGVSFWHMGYGVLLKSADGGASWFDIKDGLQGVPSHLVIDPLSSSTLYALVAPTSGYAAVGEDQKSDYAIFKSTDAGASWISMNTGLPQISENGEIHNIPLTALAIDPVTSTTLYVATAGQGVFKSVDGAASWAAMNPALTEFSINTLAVDLLNPSEIYAGTYEGGVFRYEEGTTPVASGGGGGGGGGGT